MPEERLLADVAATIADGAPVNWAHAESRADAREKRLISHLRLVAGVAQLYRSLPVEPDEAAPAPAAEPDGPRWGRLVVLERIGEGISADVHRAWDTVLHREVALKLLREKGTGAFADRGAHARMLREARRMARLRHPHIVSVYGADQQDGRVGLWMEMVRGESLEQAVKARGPFGAREAALVGIDLCAALAAVHAAGLLHRDVKAQNVMRESGGRTVLVDFGTGEERTAPRSGHRMVGTPLYLAPEIFEGGEGSVQTDLYSLGVLLFYLATGQFPVAAATMEDLARAHAAKRLRRLRDLRPDLPDAFIRVVERALAPEPGGRYESAGAMETALRGALDATASGTVAATGPIAGPTTRRARVRQLLPAVALGVVLIAIAGIYWNTRRPAPAAPAGAVMRIAVLPLADDTGGLAPPFLADALTDQLIATLGRFETMRVTSRSSVMQFKDKRVPIAEVARVLGVDAVLEGSLASGSPGEGAKRLRINARLISAGLDAPLWSGSFERGFGDLLALQADVASAIARGLSERTVGAPEAVRSSHQTSPAAEQAYFQGRLQLSQYGIEHARLALEACERATALDARHAGAHALAARALVALGFDGDIPQPEARARALAHVNQAAALDDQLADTHLALADLRFYYDWDWRGADAAYKRAIELDSSLALARTQYARYLSAAGRLDEAAQQADAAAQVDPFSSEAPQVLGLIRLFQRDHLGAIASLQHALRLAPGSARAHVVLGRVHDAAGERTQAIAETERAIALAGGAGAPWRVQVLRLRALNGQTDEARRQLVRLERELARESIRINPMHLAYLHLALGDRARALSLMEQAADGRDPDLLWIAVDPRVDPLRGDPRFDALVQRLGRP